MPKQPANVQNRRIQILGCVVLWFLFAVSCYTTIRVSSVVRGMHQSGLEDPPKSLDVVYLLSVVVVGISIGVAAFLATRKCLQERNS